MLKRFFSVELLKEVFSHKMLFMLIHGIASGTPYLLIGGTLQALLTDYKVDLETVGLVALVKVPYSLKPFWSPILDRYQLGFLQRRKAWMFVFQIALALCVASLGFIDPVAMPFVFGLMALLCGFFASSQDIVIDAYRREVLKDEELGFGSSTYIAGFRIGMIFSGAMALALSDTIGWMMTYLLMGGIILVAAMTVFFAPLEDDNIPEPKSIGEAVINPFIEFFQRKGIKEALTMLAFILFYKIGDQMASNMTMPLYLELGFSKTEIGAIAKAYGMAATFIGAFLGGAIMLRIGINKSLWVFGLLQMVSTAGFALLQIVGKNSWALTGVISFENLAAGMGTAAYAAYMASITNKQYTATQYGLLTSLMAVPMTILAAPTGWMANQMGWVSFFVFCTLIAVPGMLLLIKIAPWSQGPESGNESGASALA